MSDSYNPSEFEQKWRNRWLEADLFKTREEEGRKKFYGLEFFPYPSGAGLSVGHCRNYIPTDVLCRMKYMQGYNVLHPMGFDCFGLPAENEAIKNKVHPSPMIDRYAARYKEQMELIGMTYDWSREVKSCKPDYYKWTQWLFKLLYEKGLAYRQDAEVNWCPKDKTALANEEVVGGLCERCGTPVEKKAIPQWYFKITDYAQRLLDDLDDLDWPEGIKNQQRNWIGRSEGVEFEMKLDFAPESKEEDPDSKLDGFEVVTKEKHHSFRVFTTRIDTIFGVTFCVLAPEHPLVDVILTKVDSKHQDAVKEYRQNASRLSDIDRQATNREKTGVFTGAYAINPLNKKKVPVYIADYVLTGYGTGAIMAVPAHDERDFEFAQKFGIDVIPVITPTLGEVSEELPFTTKEGFLINSGEYSDKTIKNGVKELADQIEALGIGERKVNYKLRDWLISRQRFWGCPIPIIYDKEGNMDTVPDDALPIELPEVENYEPSEDGSSPLARFPDFVNATTRDGGLGTRETDTMGGFACSSWYFLRFCDPHNETSAWNKEKVDHWMPVDCYVGGAEHAVMHLLYARFWTKVFYDCGLVSVEEPFQKLMNQGQVLGLTPYRQPKEGETLGVGEDGILMSFAEAEDYPKDQVDWKWVRMSKSKGNVVTPEEAVEEFGSDALRLFELFVAPFEQSVNWKNEGMQGQSRFLSRVFKFVSDWKEQYDPDWQSKISQHEPTKLATDLRRATHQMISKSTQDIDRFAFNTYIATLMTTSNTYNDLLKGVKAFDPVEKLALSEAIESFILILAPAAPHSADELWESLGNKGFTYNQGWPAFNEELAKEDTLTIAVQVNGKLRDTLEVAAETGKEELESLALMSEKVKNFTDGKQIVKVIVVPRKLVNVVAK